MKFCFISFLTVGKLRDSISGFMIEFGGGEVLFHLVAVGLGEVRFFCFTSDLVRNWFTTCQIKRTSDDHYPL